jgi:hypothetical protein
VTTSRTLARRRRTFLALIGALVLTLAFLTRGGDDAVPQKAGIGPEPAAAEERAEQKPPPLAWLAWIPGGFPESFRREVQSVPGLTRNVVVAGDTLWLTATRDAEGRIVDRPKPPYAIPIDAFAVAPGEYAPFLSESIRERVTQALRSGHAVLGERSAAIRRLGSGGTLRFGSEEVEVGAVVPDHAVGWAEVLVSRQVGRRLGIRNERYLLAFLAASPTEAGLIRRLERLLPSDTPIRVDAPGTTRFVRVASGVNPPILVKEQFGEFAADQLADPAYLEIEPAWVDANIRTRSVPLLGRVTCHRKLFPQLVGALRELESKGLGHLIRVYSGCWAARTVARTSTAPPSTHAYGASIDINAPQNPFGEPPTMDPRVVEVFERWGFNWGGDFLIPDGHHFEWWTAPDQS